MHFCVCVKMRPAAVKRQVRLVADAGHATPSCSTNAERAGRLTDEDGPARETHPPEKGPWRINGTGDPLLARITDPSRARRTALIDAKGRCTYRQLVAEARAWRDAILTLDAFAPGDRVAYLIPPSPRHVAVQLGIWLARGVAIPLAVSHPVPELEHVLADARPRAVVADPDHPVTEAAISRSASVLAPDDARHHPGTATTFSRDGARHGAAPTATPAATPPRPDPLPPPLPQPADPALLIYTSGTTGPPRGVLTTHANITAQITALTTAWAWTEQDRILHTLPLHHIHGLINALACALWSGAAVEFGSGAPAATWDRLSSGEITLFMSVPTVYTRLIRAWEAAAPATRKRWSRGASGLRLMVSGSAALHAPTLERWREITGQTLLERYGMTEIGMALSNPLDGVRRAGHVGLPLPGVEVRLAGEPGQPGGTGQAGDSVRHVGDSDRPARDRQGEIEVRGPQVFREYWGRPEETAAAFRDGWFRTGDEACRGPDGYYRILGRRSVDIVKTGGYKVSALEVEALYRTHPAVRDIAVVGVAHPEWGEQLHAAWVRAGAGGTRTAAATDGDELRAWGKARLAPYKVPHGFTAVPALPRNAMGKVQKAAVRDMLIGPAARSDPHPRDPR